MSVPTGLGKTSTVDAVLWALADQVHRGIERTLGLRIFMIVERRIIVEGSGDHISDLVDAVNDSAPGSVLYPVRTALQSLSATGAGPSAATFHGSLRQLEALTPDGVQVISTTASQYTLRLAGRAPGKGPAPRATEAGMAMMDAVVLLDEPHLSAAQVHTITTAMRVQRKFRVPGVPSPQISVLGATIPPNLTVDYGIISFDPSAETTGALKRWSGVYRPLEVISGTEEHSVSSDKEIVDALVDAVGTHAVVPENHRRRSRVLVIANTVAQAEKVHARLEKSMAKENFTVRLVTGRFRADDAPTAEDLGEANRITVSTQVVEAGVDFTCDLLVSELAPWPVLTQRLGRLNRDGSSRQNALAVVVVPAKTTTSGTKYGSDGSRKIYGEFPMDVVGIGLVSAYTAAQEGATVYTKKLSVSPDKHASLVETMVAAVREQTGQDIDESVFWPRSTTPATMTTEIGSAYLETAAPVLDADTWREGIDPDLDMLDPVTVAWRGRPTAVAPDDFGTVMLGRMPLSRETVQVPLVMARDLVLVAEHTDHTDGSAEAPDETYAQQSQRRHQKVLRTAVVLSHGEWQRVTSFQQITPGCTLVIDAADGGYDREHGVVTTYGKGRLHDREDHARVSESKGPKVQDVSLRSALSMGRWAPITDASLAGAGISDGAGMCIMDALYPLDADGFLDVTVSTRKRARTAKGILVDALKSLEEFPDSSDIDIQFVSGVPAVFVPRSGGVTGTVTLADHLRQVGDTAANSAAAVGLTLTEELRDAGLLHDVGKAAPLYQLHFNAVPGEPPIAKPHGTPVRIPGIPARWRHEIASLNAMDRDTSLLTRWLVVSHHGRGRGPWFGEARTTALGWMRRELEHIYGPWGLAYLEGVLRSADIVASVAPAQQLSPLPAHVQEAMARVQTRDITELGTPQTPVVGVDYPLPGLSSATFLNILAALGVARVLSLQDPETALVWKGSTPVVTTRADQGVLKRTETLWADAVDEMLTVDGRRIATQHHKMKWEDSREPVGPEAVAEAATREHRSALANILAPAVFSPHLKMGLASKVALPVIPSALFHSNGTVFGENSVSTESTQVCDIRALDDPSAGWSSDPFDGPKRTGRLDVEPTAGQQSSRVGVAVWAMIGALSGPQVSERGLGVTGDRHRRSFTLPTVPMRVDDVASLLRGGDTGSLPVRSGRIITEGNFLYTLPGDLRRVDHA
ncbi:hypothetical protein [Corynebacterium variabile]|uniref:hypothetical protein n=1 Tax=Corynebacterium variabile TaxID=1727 RepID=UPI003FD100CA